MLTSSRARKFLAASVALAAAAGIAATANTVSYAADNAGVNTDAPVFTTTGDAPAGTSGTFTTDIANPETATAAQVAADSSSSVSPIRSGGLGGAEGKRHSRVLLRGARCGARSLWC